MGQQNQIVDQIADAIGRLEQEIRDLEDAVAEKKAELRRHRRALKSLGARDNSCGS